MDSNKEWTGNTKSTWSAVGASNHTDKEREAHDFYATHPGAIDALLSKEELGPYVWEPACGQGHLSKRLSVLGMTQVISTDLYARGFGTPGLDFLQMQEYPLQCDIVTNPPYRWALDFAKAGLSYLTEGKKLALFLRLQFLEGKERGRFFQETPPKAVYVFSNRVPCAINGDFDNIGAGSAVCYAWFVWQRGVVVKPMIDWVTCPVEIGV